MHNKYTVTIHGYLCMSICREVLALLLNFNKWILTIESAIKDQQIVQDVLRACETIVLFVYFHGLQVYIVTIYIQ